MFGRKRKDEEEVAAGAEKDARSDSEKTVTNDVDHTTFAPTQTQVKRATRTRFVWALISSFLLLITVVFLILVEIGNTSVNGTLNRIYFFKLDLSNIIPVSVPDSVLINSIAQTLGLHDFYTIGLWNYCEGYNGQGTTSCTTPQTLYWFNPVEVIQSQLLAGATIALPAELNNILDLIRLVSNWMFGLFLTGACLSFVVIFLLPLSVFTRWLSLPLSIVTFLAALTTTAASIIATVMFIIMDNVLTGAADLNIRGDLGVEMFAFMWTASATSIIAWIIQMGMCCCCASRRDVKKGKRSGSKKAWIGGQSPVEARERASTS